MYGGYQGRYEPQTYVALFEDPEPVAQVLERLRALGIDDRHIQIQSGVPWLAQAFGRPAKISAVPKYSMVGALMGFGTAIALYFGTPALYPLRVGGFPLFSLPPAFVVIFELTMLGLIIATFLGVFFESLLPPVVGKRVYHPEVSDGAIAVFFQVPATLVERAKEVLAQAGASDIEPVEGSFL